MAADRALDEIDHQILTLLRQNARRTVKDIAAHVDLSTAPVKRRIERLEKTGIIVGYTTLLSSVGSAIEAFTELKYPGGINEEAILNFLTGIAEVQGVYTTTGDTDFLVHIRADDVGHLQRIITKLRSQGNPLSSRTMIVLKRRVGGRRQPI
jgi:DNA-binding Lrp family transcriptional regulator